MYKQQVKHNSKQNKFLNMPILRLVILMSTPMICSMLAKALFNTVDSYFVSRLGMNEMAAITFAYTPQSFMNAFASGIGIALNAIMARRLGEREFESAKKAIAMSILCAIIVTVACMGFGYLFSERFFYMSGADVLVAEAGAPYLRICSIFSFGLILNACFENMLLATGHTVSGMLTQGTGFILNIILDPILIFGYLGFPAMGMSGAAIATVISQIIGLFVGVLLNLKYNRELFPKRIHFFPDTRIVSALLKVNIPTALLSLLVPVMTLGMSALLTRYSTEYVALFGIYFKLQLFMFLPIFGLNSGVIPIIGFNLGAGQTKRVKQAIICGLSLAVLIGAVGLIIFQIFGDHLLILFSATERMREIGVRAFRIISLTFPLAAFSVAISGVFQGFGNGTFGLIINIIRQLFVLVVAAVLVRSVGVVNIWYCYWISEILSIIVCVCYGTRRIPVLLQRESKVVPV